MGVVSGSPYRMAAVALGLVLLPAACTGGLTGRSDPQAATSAFLRAVREGDEKSAGDMISETVKTQAPLNLVGIGQFIHKVAQRVPRGAAYVVGDQQVRGETARVTVRLFYSGAELAQRRAPATAVWITAATVQEQVHVEVAKCGGVGFAVPAPAPTLNAWLTAAPQTDASVMAEFQALFAKCVAITHGTPPFLFAPPGYTDVVHDMDRLLRTSLAPALAYAALTKDFPVDPRAHKYTEPIPVTLYHEHGTWKIADFGHLLSGGQM